RFHLDQQVDKNRRSGMSLREAERQAAIMFGGVAQAKDDARAAIALPLLEDVSRDVRYGLRALRRAPGFAVASILTLAMGIGASTTIYMVLNAVLMRPLPFPDPERPVMIQTCAGPR